MLSDQTLEERVAERYAGLTEQLRKAADYVLAHPLEIASRSLRALAEDSNVSPATYSRLARALGYDTFGQMKDGSRLSVGQQVLTMSDRAELLRRDGAAGASMLERQSTACIGNIEQFVQRTDAAKLEEAATLLRQAERVVLLGALASTGMTEYMAYLANYFAPNWRLAGRMGASLGAQLATLGSRDVLFIVTKAPYARGAVQAARFAHETGTQVVLVTDSHKCPALAFATYSFVVPSDSPQFFSSYTVTLVLIETLIAMIVAASEAETTASIRKVEAKNLELGEYWSE